MNYLIGIGAIILYIDVCFYVIPSTDQLSSTIYCNVCDRCYVQHALKFQGFFYAI